MNFNNSSEAEVLKTKEIYSCKLGKCLTYSLNFFFLHFFCIRGGLIDGCMGVMNIETPTFYMHVDVSQIHVQNVICIIIIYLIAPNFHGSKIS